MELFDDDCKYVYTPYLIQITLNKKKAQVNDFIIANIIYNSVGKLQSNDCPRYDSVTLSGKIRLKVRDSKFTLNDFTRENETNDFYLKLKQRPDTIKKLSFMFDLAFPGIVNQLYFFTNLEDLDLTGTNLDNTNFAFIKDLRTLKSLTLNDCNLSRFPLTILDLPKLETLNIWNNKISNIPEGLYQMTSLKHLTIGNNDLAYLSPKISNLLNLESFESSATNIRVYPKEMLKLKKLKEIYPSDTMYYIPKALIKYAWGYDTILNK